MSSKHHFLMLKKWHPSNRANLTKRYEKEQEDKDRKRREEAARYELEKRKERFLFDKMIEMRDGKKAPDDQDMKLAFMYAVPDNIKEEEKRRKERKEDADVERFKALYLTPRVIDEIPKEVIEDPQKIEEEEEAQQNPMKIYENQIKDEKGQLNYDRVEDLVRKYQSDIMSKQRDINATRDEKHLRQFTSKAIQISKGMYRKADTPVGGNIDPALNTYVESSSENDSDQEVLDYINTLSEKDRALLLSQLEHKKEKHRHKHIHKKAHRKHHSV